MVYFKMTDLIGTLNSKETYLFFLTIKEWCRTHLDSYVWEFDYSTTIYVQGVNVPIGIRFYTIKDSADFINFI
jgi:hypothetical protein